jgi:hypothetical protein
MKERLTYGNVVATLALFLALGGGIAFAIANNSVKSRHIVNGQVKRADIKGQAVNSAKVANNSLTGADINEETLANGVVTRSAVSTSGATPSVTADCDPGERAIGGGVSLSTSGAVVRISRPSPASDGTTPDGWTAASSHPAATAHQVAAYVLCATP